MSHTTPLMTRGLVSVSGFFVWHCGRGGSVSGGGIDSRDVSSPANVGEQQIMAADNSAQDCDTDSVDGLVQAWRQQNSRSIGSGGSTEDAVLYYTANKVLTDTPKQVTQADFAEKFGVSADTISQYWRDVAMEMIAINKRA